MKIAIDIGHCSTGDRGAVSACGLSEHAYWAANAGQIKKALEKLRHSVKIFRREDYNRLVSRECQAINEWEADIAVSLHLNSSDNTGACGHEVIHHPASKRGARLASCINGKLAAIGYTADRGTKPPFQNRGNAYLSNCHAPAVIIEAGFLSSAQDTAALKENAVRISLAIAEGIDTFINS